MPERLLHKSQYVPAPGQIFVESGDNTLGVGKLTALDNAAGVVAYFLIAGDESPMMVTVPRASLKRITLSRETRVFWHNPQTSRIEVGRVLDYIADDRRYLVRFPNDARRLLSEDELIVRCRIPIDDPTETLALQLNETAFWHEGRSELVRYLYQQRNSASGLTGLLSSSIELVRHQVAVIRRVLSDPFPRYLLADEVGLGKTIEAGVLIRQFVLDDPQAHDTLIIVPFSLKAQWLNELTTKFHLADYLGKTIHVAASEDRQAIEKYGSTARLVVIDEAHHLSAWAWAKDTALRSIYAALERIVEPVSKRVLLLSATPVLYNEKAFLAMLRLLDPQVYSLEDLPSFQHRIQLRQVIAECLASLVAGESNYFLSQTLNELRALVPEDDECQRLCMRLDEVLSRDPSEDDPYRNSLIDALRTHVSDTWRIHRRILRNRKSAENAWCSPGRQGYDQLTYASADEQSLAEAVDSWRLHVAHELYSFESAARLAASEIVRTAVELLHSDRDGLMHFIDERLRLPIGTTPKSNLLGDDERELLEIARRASKRCNGKERLDRLRSFIDAADKEESFLIFTSQAGVADAVFQFLKTSLSNRLVLRHSISDSGWLQFKSARQTAVLVADRSAEEGLNLQRRRATVIHFDLPLSPNRIEQRLGRLDRFGTGRAIRSVVLLCEGNPLQETWLRLVGEALGVFSRSIATLQYIVDSEMTQIWSDFLDGGRESFERGFQRLSGKEGRVATELQRIHAQDQLDSFDEDALSHDSFDTLEAFDFRSSREGNAIDTWLVSRLNFQKRIESQHGREVFSYGFSRRDDFGRGPAKDARDTLVPLDEFRRHFIDSIDTVPPRPPVICRTVPFTLDRVVAQSESTRLLRVGDPFIESLEQFARADDRGGSFAFWRVMQEHRSEHVADLFFRFDFVISPDIKLIEDFAETSGVSSVRSLLRRATSFMPPLFATIWLDADFESVTDEGVLSLIQKPYQKGTMRQSKDYNLNTSRWEQAANVIDLSNWRERCSRAREVALQVLRAKSNLPGVIESCSVKATQAGERIVQQFNSRIALSTGTLRSSLESERDFESVCAEQIVKSLNVPHIRIDSVGCVFVSSTMPFVEKEKVEGDE